MEYHVTLLAVEQASSWAERGGGGGGEGMFAIMRIIGLLDLNNDNNGVMKHEVLIVLWDLNNDNNGVKHEVLINLSNFHPQGSSPLLPRALELALHTIRAPATSQ